MNKKRLRAAAVMTAAISLFSLLGSIHAEAAGGLQVSDRLVGEGKLIESTEGLTPLSDSEEKSFIDAVDKKYAEEIIEDYSGDAKIEMSVKMPVKQFGGARMNVNVTADAKFAESETSKMSMAECDITSSVLLVSTTMKAHSYIDKENRTEYRKISSSKDQGWTKNEKKSGISTETEIPFLRGDMIRDVYRNPETGAYAALLEIREDTLEKLIGSGVDGLREVGIDDVDLDKGIYIATLDEGVSLIGMYADLTDAAKGEKISVSRCIARAMIRTINSGLTIELPEEAKSAKSAKAGKK